MDRSDLVTLTPPSTARYSERFSLERLNDWMSVGDPLADTAVVQMRQQGYEPRGPQLESLRALAADGDDAAQAFFAAADEVPDWVDRELITHGQEFAMGLVHLYGLSLFHSLFAGGVFMRAALVTGATGRLGSDASTRIVETAAFIARIMEPGSLEPGGGGSEAIAGVRLLHGSIRHWTRKLDGFEASYVGVPIDQTMLAMTLASFSYLNMRSLARLGVRVTDRDVEAHHHLWRLVGHRLGIRPELQTDSTSDERELWNALVAHQAFPELYGADVLDALSEQMAGVAAPRRVRPQAASYLRDLLVHLSGPEFLGLDPATPMPRVTPAATRAIGVSMGALMHLPGPLPAHLATRGRRALHRSSARGKDQGYRVQTADRSETERRYYDRATTVVSERFAGI